VLAAGEVGGGRGTGARRDPPHCRPHARGYRQRTAPSGPGGGQEARLHAVARLFDPLGLEPLHYQCSGYSVAAADGLPRLRFTVAG
jgi:hypothetical protein